MNQETMTAYLMEYGIPAIIILVALAAAWIFSNWVRRLITKRAEKAGLEPTIARFIGTLVRALILISVVVGLLGKFGIQTASFAAILAAMGFAVGMAFQGALGNFAAGVLMLVFRPFKVGDLITAGGHTGTVFDIGLVVTAIDTPDNNRVIIPNSEVFSNSIVNHSFHDMRRVDVNVGTDYSASLDTVRGILQAAADSVPGQADKRAEIFLSDLGDSSINWQVRTWSHPDDYWPVWDATTQATKDALDAAGISIPFPQRDIHSIV